MPPSKVTTGARTIFAMDGKQLVFASNVSYNINHNLAPVDTLDRVTPVEYAEVGYTIDFSFNSYRVSDKSAIALGIQPKLQDIIKQPELSATLIDRVTGKTIAQMDRVKMRRRSGTVDARGLLTESFDFVGIVFSDEAGPNVDQPSPG